MGKHGKKYRAGAAKIDAEKQYTLDEAITLATLPAYKPVVEGEMIATVKIIPFAVAKTARDKGVAAGAKAANLGMVDEDDADVCVVAPGDQRVRHVTDHLAIEAMQRLRAVETQAAGEALLDRQHVRLGRRSVHHGIFA